MVEIQLINVIAIIGVILVSMTLHEAMHGFVAYWLGDDTAKLQGRLTLNPIKHIDPFLTILLPLTLYIVGAPVFGGAKPVPFNPNRVRYDEWGAALVALSGPLTNLLLAFTIFGVGALFGYNISAFTAQDLWGTILTYGVIINLGFFIFNMIPLPPLDGSRVLYAIAPEFVRRGMEFIEQYGLIFVFALVLVLSNYIGPLIGQLIQFIVDIFAKIFIV